MYRIESMHRVRSSKLLSSNPGALDKARESPGHGNDETRDVRAWEARHPNGGFRMLAGIPSLSSSCLVEVF